jgi:hypothetical protein
MGKKILVFIALLVAAGVVYAQDKPDGSTSYIFQNYSTTSIFGGISWSF